MQNLKKKVRILMSIFFSQYFTVDGEWGQWSRFTYCSATCGPGVMSRSRFCDKPAPENGGKDCRGRSFDSRRCENRRCPSKYEKVRGGGACPGAGSAMPRPLQTAGKTVEVGPSTVDGVRTGGVRVSTKKVRGGGHVEEQVL